jgi:hypothetical protein
LNTLASALKLEGETGHMVDVDRRRMLVLEITDLVEARELSAIALAPFVFASDAPTVVSMAALNMAALLPGNPHDPLHGIRRLRDSAERFEESEPERCSAILHGLLLLGDRRVCTLLERTRTHLQEDTLLKWARAWSGTVFVAVVDFFLDWAEETVGVGDEVVFSGVAAALVRMALEAGDGMIHEISRRLRGSEGEGVGLDLEGSELVTEYGAKIMARFAKIASKEKDEPKLMGPVMAAWRGDREDEDLRGWLTFGDRYHWQSGNR